MTYQYSIEHILEWLADPPQATERNEGMMRQALREINLRLFRVDLEGHNSLSLDRIADKLEAAILDLRQRRRELEKAQGWS